MELYPETCENKYLMCTARLSVPATQEATDTTSQAQSDPNVKIVWQEPQIERSDGAYRMGQDITYHLARLQLRQFTARADRCEVTMTAGLSSTHGTWLSPSS